MIRQFESKDRAQCATIFKEAFAKLYSGQYMDGPMSYQKTSIFWKNILDNLVLFTEVQSDENSYA